MTPMTMSYHGPERVPGDLIAANAENDGRLSAAGKQLFDRLLDQAVSIQMKKIYCEFH